MSISDKITRLQTAKSNIATAITTKGGTVSSGDGFEDFASDIASIPSGGGRVEAEEKDINFYDYDGFRVESWTLAELQNKTALPTPPDHSSDITWAGDTIPLTFDGWNWTLADLQEVNHEGINVGAMFKTTDDALHLCVRLVSPRLSPYISLAVNGTAYIDWGDDSTPTIVTGTSTSTAITNTHTYSHGDEYHIVISKANGSSFGVPTQINNNTSKLFWSNDTTANSNKKYNTALIEAYLPCDIISNGGMFYYMRNLQKISISNYIMKNDFDFTASLVYLTVPANSTIKSSSFNFQPTGLRNISLIKGNRCPGNFLREVQGIQKSPYFADTTKFDGYFFYNATSLAQITIPSTITQIGGTVLANCYSLGEIKFEPTTPPTIAGTSFQNLPTDCKILVPSGSLSAYTSATNYPSASTYTYEEY